MNSYNNNNWNPVYSNNKNSRNIYKENIIISTYSDSYISCLKSNGDIIKFPPNNPNLVEGQPIIIIDFEINFKSDILFKKLDINKDDNKLDTYIKSQIKERIRAINDDFKYKCGGATPSNYNLNVIINITQNNLHEYTEVINGVHYLISNYLGLIFNSNSNGYIENPFSEYNVNLNEARKLYSENNNLNFFKGGISLVQRNSKFKHLFINLLGEVQKIPIIDKDGLVEGLYLFSMCNKKMINNTFIPLAELDNKSLGKLGIYTSKEECINNNLEKINKELNNKIDNLNKRIDGNNKAINNLKDNLKDKERIIGDLKLDEKIRNYQVKNERLIKGFTNSYNNLVEKLALYKTELNKHNDKSGASEVMSVLFDKKIFLKLFK